MKVEAFAEPFRHWLIDGAVADLPPADALPAPDWPGWVRYENAFEKKRTTRDVHLLPDPWARLFLRLASQQLIAELRKLADLPPLVPDGSLHGGGVHVVDAGGELGAHIDYALHPVCGLERRLNLILFLSDWQEEWGGAFQLYEDDARTLAKQVFPARGRLVLWEPSDVAYHGTQPVAEGAPPRVTAAVYYLAPARPTATRKVALFAPRR